MVRKLLALRSSGRRSCWTEVTMYWAVEQRLQCIELSNRGYSVLSCPTEVTVYWAVEQRLQCNKLSNKGYSVMCCGTEVTVYWAVEQRLLCNELWNRGYSVLSCRTEVTMYYCITLEWFSYDCTAQPCNTVQRCALATKALWKPATSFFTV